MTTKRARERRERLLPNGKPRYVRIYDTGPDGGYIDRYTVVFTGNYPNRPRGWTEVLSMSERPFGPLGVGLHAEYRGAVDRPRYGHLGKKITFDDLPPDCQRAVLMDYMAAWNLT